MGDAEIWERSHRSQVGAYPRCTTKPTRERQNTSKMMGDMSGMMKQMCRNEWDRE
jgi:hypothetical protein